MDFVQMGLAHKGYAHRDFAHRGSVHKDFFHKQTVDPGSAPQHPIDLQLDLQVQNTVADNSDRG